MKKTSKNFTNFGGGNWVNALYYTKPSLYYPAAYWDTPGGDSTIRLSWANAFCLNIKGGGNLKPGAEIIAWPCVDKKGHTADNMKFIVGQFYIKVKQDPSLCISYKGKAMKGSVTLTLQKCGKKGTFQKIQQYDDMTIRFVDAKEYGFNVFLGIDSNPKNRYIKTYKVSAAKNEAFTIRSQAPPTPKPTPSPTPSPPLTGLKKAKGWSIVKGKCTIDISAGPPCAVSGDYPKKYANEDSCTVKMTKTEAVKASNFVTEKYFDVVTIGSIKLHGNLKIPKINLPKGVSTIVWSSDFWETHSGWKICKTKKGSPPMPKLKKRKGKGKKAKKGQTMVKVKKNKKGKPKVVKQKEKKFHR